MNIYTIAVLLFSFGVLLIAVLSLWRKCNIVSVRFALFSASVCGWGFLYSAWANPLSSPELTLKLVRISEFFVIFIPITLIHFAAEFASQKEPFKHFYKVNYGVAFFLCLICPTPLFIKGVHEVPIFGYYKSLGVFYYVLLAQFLFMIPYAYYGMFKAYLKAVGEEKMQLKFILIAWVLSYFSALATFLPAFNIFSFEWMILLFPACPFFVGIALMRYGLFDEQQIADAFQREKLTAIGIMAASLNHELRNPLYVAKGRVETHVDLVESGKAQMDAKSKSAFDTVYNQLKRALEIIDRFSNFAKPPMQDKKEDIVVKDAFNDVFHLVSKEFETRNIKVKQVPTNGLTIRANRRQFEEILFNLTMNACHAMSFDRHSCEGRNLSDREKQLTFNASQPNGKVIVEIKDNGPGITKEDQKRIFDPFYTTKGKKGSGLGLYITKQLVERNNGKIKLKSKIGEGTQFKLEFPTK